MMTEADIREMEATEAGALDGFESTCQSCGMVLSSSLFTCLLNDIAEHGAWHDRNAR